MVNCDFPPNVIMLYKILAPLFLGDVLNVEWLTEYFLAYDEEKQTKLQDSMDIY